VYEPCLRSDKQSLVCISICDTGSGIDPEHAKHLFEPFFTTKSTKGTGLGLWISKGIIQKYGGSIRFRSMPVAGSHVTCFRVLLPEAEFRCIGEPAQTFPQTEPIKVLAGGLNGG
jgi:signal transduction histidine kinase